MSSLPPGPVAFRRDLLWLAVGAAILFLLFLGARDLWNPNEPIYGQAVVEMYADGRWLVPSVNGMVFAEKPILYFWLGLVSSHLLGGVSEFALRLPSALAGVAGVLMVYLLVCPVTGALRARLAASLFATTFLVYWSARAVQMDLLVSVCTLGAVLAAVRVLDHGGAVIRGGLLCGLAAGLGFLAKGPIGLICPAMVLLIYATVSGQLARLSPRFAAAAVIACLAVAAPWLVWLWARGETAFLSEMLYRQNFTRFLDPWDHQRPWWYFLVNFWIDMAPWALFLPLAAALPDRDDAERKLDRLAWCWIVGVVVFFSFSASKRGAYILPAAPAVAMLVSGLFEQLATGALPHRRKTLLDTLVGALGVLLLAGAAYVLFVAIDDVPMLSAEGRALGLLMAAGGTAILTGLLMRRREPLAATSALFAVVVSLYLLAAVWVLPAVDRYKSARPFSGEVVARVAPERPLRIYGGWKWRAGYAFYTGRRIDRLTSPAELASYWDDPAEVYLIVEGDPSEAQSVIGDAPPVVSGRVGSQRVHLFRNR